MNNTILIYLVLAVVSTPIFSGDKASKPKLYNLEQFLNASAGELWAHKKQLDELQKEGILSITPSQAQLFYSYSDPVVSRDQLAANLGMATGKSFPLDNARIFTPEQIRALNKVTDEEQRIYDNGGVAVYHSTQPEHWGASYIRSKDADFILDITGTPVAPSKMLLLRDTICRADLKAEKATRKKYLKHGVPRPEVDMEKHHAANLLSCNIGVAGNSLEGASSSSLEYWLKKKNANLPAVDLEKTLESRNLIGEKTVKEKLQNALDEFKLSTTTGVLLQLVFKNKKKVDDIMYSSQPFGYKQEYEFGEKEPRLKLAKPTTIIDTIMQQPSAFEKNKYQINTPQMRVVLTADQLLDATNPEIRKNVEINAYVDNENAMNEFRTRVDAIFASAKEDYLARYHAMSLPRKLLHRLRLNMFYKRTPPAERKRIKKESEHWFIAQ